MRRIKTHFLLQTTTFTALVDRKQPIRDQNSDATTHAANKKKKNTKAEHTCELTQQTSGNQESNGDIFPRQTLCPITSD